MFIVIQPITLLQKYLDFLYLFGFIIESFLDPDDNLAQGCPGMNGLRDILPTGAKEDNSLDSLAPTENLMSSSD